MSIAPLSDLAPQGHAKATKVLGDDGEETEVYSYGPSDYFGELALLHDQPRAANVIAVGRCKVRSLFGGSALAPNGIVLD